MMIFTKVRCYYKIFGNFTEIIDNFPICKSHRKNRVSYSPSYKNALDNINDPF